MTDQRREWTYQRDRLLRAMEALGFPETLGAAIAKQLGSPRAMERMCSYLYNVRPTSEELVVDEMLAICSDIDAWREKKATEEANAKYNEMRFFGLGVEEDA
ncbi:MAG: hypothetical protein K5744_04455 [Eubacterium sp.]|nr:hypothetical protein [Eubacterium sp.]